MTTLHPYNPLDNGEPFNQDASSDMPPITQQETLDGLDRIQALVEKSKELLHE